MRLNPELLRRRPASLDRPMRVAEIITGERLLLAILSRVDDQRVPRKSFWEVIADYNPLGQFGAAHSQDFSAR